jgi:hypothetical protein
VSLLVGASTQEQLFAAAGVTSASSAQRRHERESAIGSVGRKPA